MNPGLRQALTVARSATTRPLFVIGCILTSSISMVLTISFYPSPATFVICAIGMILLIADLKFLKSIKWRR